MIRSEASLDKDSFRNLVKHLEQNNYIMKVKSSYKLTDFRKEFYNAVKVETTNVNFSFLLEFSNYISKNQF